MNEFRLGSVGHWGVRGVLRGDHKIADVPIRGGLAPLEERRAERDRTAQMIVDALNHWHIEDKP